MRMAERGPRCGLALKERWLRRRNRCRAVPRELPPTPPCYHDHDHRLDLVYIQPITGVLRTYIIIIIIIIIVAVASRLELVSAASAPSAL